MTEKVAGSNLTCHNCRHFYITWDSKFPYGCAAIKFKSKTLPSTSVLQESGMPCLMFREKTGVKPKKDSKAKNS
jgi:hypothetical protein